MKPQLMAEPTADYLAFLESKVEIAKESGFDVGDSQIHPVLLPH